MIISSWVCAYLLDIQDYFMFMLIYAYLLYCKCAIVIGHVHCAIVALKVCSDMKILHLF